MRAMRKGVAAVLAGVGFVACSNAAPQSANNTPVVVPSVTPPAPGAPTSVMTFEGHYDAKAKELTVAYRVPSSALGTADVLPYGTGVDQVYFHTVSITWQGACGTNRLCAPVTARNGYTSGSVTNLQALFDAFGPSDVTAVNAPYSYGTVGPRVGSTDGESSPVTWTFSDPTGANFQFIGHAEGTPPAPTGNAALGASPDPLVLPTLLIGTSQTNPSYVTVTETSGTSATGALTVTRNSGGAAEIVAGTAGCSGTSLVAGGNCQNAYTLNCTSTTVSGSKSATFTVADTASTATVTYTVSGTCDPASTGTAFLTIAPTTYDFGNVFLGTTATPTPDFTVQNTGDGTTGSLAAPAFTAKTGNAKFKDNSDCGGTVLAPFDQCSVGQNLDCRSPATAGAQGVTVTETDPTSGSSVSIVLTGNCVCRTTNMSCTTQTASQCCSGVCVANKCT